MTITDNGQTPAYPCPHCGDVFTTVQGRNGHLSTHRASTTKCRYCRRKFGNSIHVARHEAQCPDNPERVPYDFACDHCAETFLTRQSLRNHRARAHPETRKPKQQTSTLTVGDRVTRDDLVNLLGAVLPDGVPIEHAGRVVECVDALYALVSLVQAQR